MIWVVLLLLVSALAFSKEIRHYIFARADAKCEWCGRSWYDGYMLEADHILPSYAGGTDKADNGRMLCRECHLLAHEKLYNQALKCNDKRGINANAHAIRKLKERISKLGIYRYGYPKKKPPR